MRRMTLRLTLMALLAAPAAFAAAPDSLVAEWRRDPDAMFFDLRHRDILAVTQSVLESPAAGDVERARALRALGAIYAVRGAGSQARAAFAAYFAIRPGAELEPTAAWPPAVVRHFYAVRDSLGQAAPAPPSAVTTLAVGPMDNHSPKLPGASLDMDRFAAGMTAMIVSDLSGATALRLVDRQRLDVLRAEIDLSRSGFVDPAQAVRAGRLLGAQSYLFGGVTLLPPNRVRIDLRLVKTETSEILLAASRERTVEDGGDLLKLEREVVEALAKRLDVVAAEAGAPKESISKAARGALEARARNAALELVEATGAALLAEDAGDLEGAARHWKAVLALDADNGLATTRLRAVETETGYAQLAEGE
jgi:curli biogenesis system outer membrane secretion channel CsgG